MAKRKRTIRKGTAEEDRRSALAADAERAEIPANRTMIRRIDESRREAALALIEALKVAREEAGLSLADLQERTGIARSNLSRIENQKGSNPTLATLERYAAAVGCRIEVRVVKNGS